MLTKHKIDLFVFSWKFINDREGVLLRKPEQIKCRAEQNDFKAGSISYPVKSIKDLKGVQSMCGISNVVDHYDVIMIMMMMMMMTI